MMKNSTFVNFQESGSAGEYIHETWDNPDFSYVGKKKYILYSDCDFTLTNSPDYQNRYSVYQDMIDIGGRELIDTTKALLKESLIVPASTKRKTEAYAKNASVGLEVDYISVPTTEYIKNMIHEESGTAEIYSKLLLGAMALAGVDIPRKVDLLKDIRNNEKIWNNYTPAAQERYLSELMKAQNAEQGRC